MNQTPAVQARRRWSGWIAAAAGVVLVLAVGVLREWSAPQVIAALAAAVLVVSAVTAAASAWAGREPTGAEPELSSGVQWALVLVCAFALVAVLVFVIGDRPSPAAALAAASAGVVVLFAAGALGVVLGFLFGLPTLSAEEREDLMSADSTVARFIFNSSVSRISDWLTSIIVGVGLIELRRIPDALGALGRVIGPALGGSPAAPVVIIALMIGTGATGFLCAFLMTSIYLKRELERTYGGPQLEEPESAPPKDHEGRTA